MRRKVLVTVVILAIVMSLAMVAVPFVSAMKPPANAGETLPHIDISLMEPETYKIHKVSSGSWVDRSYLIIRKSTDEFSVYSLPTKNGEVVMPDLMWFRWGGLCKRFGPEMVEGKIEPEGLIKCHDSDLDEYFVKEWRWTFEGKKLGRWTADLRTVSHKRSGKYLVLSMD